MGSSYFSDREQGPQTRVKEEITNGAWGGVIATINNRINDGSFGYRYPKVCPDGTCPCGCDEDNFFMALRAEIHDIPCPLYFDQHLNQAPPTIAILDLIVECTPVTGALLRQF